MARDRPDPGAVPPPARFGGGDLVSLDDDKVLIRQVLELTFGARWKVEMAKYLKELS